MNDTKIKNAIKGWLVVLVGAFFYLYQFMLRISPNIMNNELMHVLSIDAATLGTLIGTYYWAYALMQLPLGITMDRLGPRYFLCSAALLCAVSCYLFGHTHNVYVAQMARFFMGMGSACGLVGTLKLGTVWVDKKHIAKVTALTILMGTVGAGLGGMPLKYILIKVGFIKTMELLAYLGAVVALVIFVSIKIYPPIPPQKSPIKGQTTHPWHNLLTIFRSKQAWITAIYGMLMYAPITIIGIAWGVPFIEKTYGFSEMLAASVVSTMFLGSALGSPCAAFISDVLLKQRRLPMVLGSILAMTIWSIVLMVPSIPLTLMYGLFFCGGIAYTFKTLTFASICEIMPQRISATAIAFVNMVVMSTGIVFHPLIGWLIDHHWNGSMNNGTPVYSVEDYRYALMVIPVSLLISTFLLIFMRECHPEARQQVTGALKHPDFIEQ